MARLPYREKERGRRSGIASERVGKRSREVRERKRGNGGVLIDDVKSSGRAKRGAKPETGALNPKRQRTSNDNTIDIMPNLPSLILST